MNSVERVKAICKERKIPISRLERDLGYANGYIAQLRKGVFPSDRLIEIANYLSVSPDYLMNGDGHLSPSGSIENAPTLPSERRIFNENEEGMLLLARHMEPLPEEERKLLQEQFRSAIDVYLKAKGLLPTEGE